MKHHVFSNHLNKSSKIRAYTDCTSYASNHRFSQCKHYISDNLAYELKDNFLSLNRLDISNSIFELFDMRSVHDMAKSIKNKIESDMMSR